MSGSPSEEKNLIDLDWHIRYIGRVHTESLGYFFFLMNKNVKRNKRQNETIRSFAHRNEENTHRIKMV